jgi:hypothetical protein
MLMESVFHFIALYQVDKRLLLSFSEKQTQVSSLKSYLALAPFAPTLFRRRHFPSHQSP